MNRREFISCVPGAAQRDPKASGALQTRDRSDPWRSRISGAPLHFATRCTASGTRGIGRRAFITALAAAAAWPRLARAQGMPVIGYLNGAPAAGWEVYVSAFLRGLAETGYAEGKNLRIDYSWADNQYDRLPGLAADLVRRDVAVIFSDGGTVTALTAQ